eukprot:m.246218 g.246218  ORF g.246218 m.246218 type:complete len:53 (-) comp68226_c0_seq1:2-160(-)
MFVCEYACVCMSVYVCVMFNLVHLSHKFICIFFDSFICLFIVVVYIGHNEAC